MIFIKKWCIYINIKNREWIASLILNNNKAIDNISFNVNFLYILLWKNFN